MVVEGWFCVRAVCLLAVLATAARHVESEGVQGSCTACLLTINKDTGRLQAATLGDSGFLIVGPRAPQHGDLEVRSRGGCPGIRWPGDCCCGTVAEAAQCDDYASKISN